MESPDQRDLSASPGPLVPPPARERHVKYDHYIDHLMKYENGRFARYERDASRPLTRLPVRPLLTARHALARLLPNIERHLREEDLVSPEGGGGGRRASSKRLLVRTTALQVTARLGSGGGGGGGGLLINRERAGGWRERWRYRVIVRQSPFMAALRWQ